MRVSRSIDAAEFQLMPLIQTRWFAQRKVGRSVGDVAARLSAPRATGLQEPASRGEVIRATLRMFRRTKMMEWGEEDDERNLPDNSTQQKDMSLRSQPGDMTTVERGR